MSSAITAIPEQLNFEKNEFKKHSSGDIQQK